MGKVIDDGAQVVPTTAPETVGPTGPAPLAVAGLRLVAYRRVSTDHQASDGFGLDTQAAAIDTWAANAGANLVDAVDEAETGTVSELGRPVLAELLLRLERGEVDGMVCARLDRLARTLTVQEAILGTVWRHGGRLFAANMGEILEDDPDDPMRTAMRQMAGVFAQLERAMLLARMRAGRRAKHEAGGFAFGSPPFGWVADGSGGLVEVAGEQAVISRIVGLRVEGRPMHAIAAALNEAGVVSQRGGRWGAESVRRVLRRADPGLLARVEVVPTTEPSA